MIPCSIEGQSHSYLRPSFILAEAYLDVTLRRAEACMIKAIPGTNTYSSLVLGGPDKSLQMHNLEFSRTGAGNLPRDTRIQLGLNSK